MIATQSIIRRRHGCHNKKLDAIERLETRPVDRLFTGIPVRGLASTLYLHPEPFVCEGEMYLLGTVLFAFSVAVRQR
ncbi:hypothetical protein ACP0HM_31125 [Escherichia coli]